MLKHIYRDVDGTLTDLSAWAPRLEMQSTEKAEEGAVASWTVTIDDPEGELDFNGHRQYFVEETTSLETDDIVFGGFVAAQDVLPWPGRPLGRVWVLELTDANTFWQRTIMRGSDCNRPAETDTTRMAWLLGTSEAALINDAVSYVASIGGVAMDAHDYRGEYLGQIVADCSMQSGRNWFLWWQKQGDGTRDLIAWYKRDNATDYVSPLYLTNDIADLELDGLDDGSTLIYPLSADTKLRRDPSRVYCGCYMAYEAGVTYRHNATTHAAFAHRDISATQPTVKTQAKAQARADRMLADLNEQDVRITTSVILPAARVTQLRAGMRTEIRGTHWPDGWDDWHYVRVLEASPEPISVGRQYRVDLELALDTGDASPGPPTDYTGSIFAAINRAYVPTGTTMAYNYNTTVDAGPGSSTIALAGPIQVDQSSAPFSSITALQDMTVGIGMNAAFAEAFFPALVMRIDITVNGVSVAFDQTTAGPGFWSELLTCSVDNYHLDAGDVVSFTYTHTDDWGAGAPEQTYLAVVRGDHGWDGGAGHALFTGPAFGGPYQWP